MVNDGNSITTIHDAGEGRGGKNTIDKGTKMTGSRVGCVKASRGQHVFHTPMTPDTPDFFKKKLFPYSDETIKVLEWSILRPIH